MLRLKTAYARNRTGHGARQETAVDSYVLRDETRPVCLRQRAGTEHLRYPCRRGSMAVWD